MNEEQTLEYFKAIVDNVSHVNEHDATILNTLLTNSKENTEFTTWLEDVKTMYGHIETIQKLSDNEIIDYLTTLKGKLDSDNS
ncbi:hypothetical protein SAM19_05018 [Brevibacillus laterosporus]|nr:hypothetical protein [Brevibacillus laterosporus]